MIGGMFDLLFLGTSASVPHEDRNQPSLLISAGRNRFLIDCGEGTQRQLLRSGAGFRRLSRLLLTHGHLDHILGIPGLLATLALQRDSDGIMVQGGADTLAEVARMLEGIWGRPPRQAFSALAAGETIAEEGFSITAFPVTHHGTDSRGYAFETTPRRRLRADRLAALGVPDGPIRKELADGKPVTLPDGRTIDPPDVLDSEERSVKLVVVGDTETIHGLAEHVRNADLLVIEATFLQRDAAIARTHRHLTAAESAALAREAGVKKLVLNHISGRYPAEEILEEAKRIFEDVVVANDFDEFRVSAPRCETPPTGRPAPPSAAPP